MIELRVTDIKQYEYCPRVVYFSYLMPVEKKTTFKMEHGKLAEDDVDRLEKRRGLKEYGLTSGERFFHVWLRSEKLGLSGKLDLLLHTPDGRFPVDFKETRSVVWKNHVSQLVGYSLLVEENYSCTVNLGYLYFLPEEKVVPVAITREDKETARQVLQGMREMLERESMPEPSQVEGRCEECEFRNFCGDVF